MDVGDLAEDDGSLADGAYFAESCCRPTNVAWASASLPSLIVGGPGAGGLIRT
jgi:hypothetical protein